MSDTGSTINIIETGIARSLDLRIMPYNKYRYGHVYTMTGDEIQCVGVAHFAWTFPGQSIIWEDFFHVVDGFPGPMALGAPFLRMTGVVLSPPEKHLRSSASVRQCCEQKPDPRHHENSALSRTQFTSVLPTIPIQFASGIVRALVDTGSEVNVMTAQFAVENDYDVRLASKTLVLATGQEIMTEGFVEVKLTTSISGLRNGALVANPCHRDYPVIHSHSVIFEIIPRSFCKVVLGTSVVRRLRQRELVQWNDSPLIRFEWLDLDVNILGRSRNDEAEVPIHFCNALFNPPTKKLSRLLNAKTTSPTPHPVDLVADIQRLDDEEGRRRYLHVVKRATMASRDKEKADKEDELARLHYEHRRAQLLPTSPPTALLVSSASPSPVATVTPPSSTSASQN
ncbi:hypothetical protein BDZ85DRAFT_286329 [Elsinoe ampelina]|uniref:Uncharacterized protein n=1 Tax=Elsinoe ampelina TaxID=302913 RepID=A0A6A6FYH4_9PEZI|nr:hypothetical protein BDZ85DRAFT_286329 [Elsinoe ampelina]